MKWVSQETNHCLLCMLHLLTKVGMTKMYVDWKKKKENKKAVYLEARSFENLSTKLKTGLEPYQIQ